MTDINPNSGTAEAGPRPPTWRNRVRPRRNALLVGAAIILLAAGAATGAGGIRLAQLWQPHSVMLLQPMPIDQIRDGTPVAIKGSVAEIFGNKFILQDGSGRALIDLGPRGENGNVVIKGEDITVQGRFDRGVIHAQVVVHADGRNEVFGPPDRGPPGPPKGPKGKDRDHARGKDEPRRPPPPPAADRGPPPPTADRGPPPPPPVADRGGPSAPPPPPDRAPPPNPNNAASPPAPQQ